MAKPPAKPDTPWLGTVVLMLSWHRCGGYLWVGSLYGDRIVCPLRYVYGVSFLVGREEGEGEMGDHVLSN